MNSARNGVRAPLQNALPGSERGVGRFAALPSLSIALLAAEVALRFIRTRAHPIWRGFCRTSLTGDEFGVLKRRQTAVLLEGLADIGGHRWNIAVLLLTTLRD